ncbi:hypothetical protein Poly51_15550 [Rubripirellula tenax]|uniref:Thioredoxin domain-containing protein n=1 Tax=Rubripirellula tenax TaxID=2528015 RepID=A0A5C6FBE7_9BACT|nr:TlpA disulfide reductase family protein [Rubripirellula tenax]TWU58775.1 hypothetical protein Poly51_15550 [Rubripirellula tenax]
MTVHHTQHPVFRRPQATATLLAILVTSWVGCGGSATQSVPDAVATTSSPLSTASVTEAVEAPGEIELPPDLVPTLSTQPSKSSGGFEMPSDELPQTAKNQTARKPPINESAKVQFASWDAIQSQVTSSGKITVVDLWSLSCEPCLKEFPELVRLHQSKGTSIQCISVNLDFDGRKSRPPEHYETKVASFLDSVKAEGFRSYICTTASDDVYATANIDSIPTVMVFDAAGKPVKVFVDAGETIGFTYKKDVLPLLETLTQ